MPGRGNECEHSFRERGQERPRREGHVWVGVKGSEGFLFVCLHMYESASEDNDENYQALRRASGSMMWERI